MNKITLEERTEYENIKEVLADGFKFESQHQNFYTAYKGETMYAFKQRNGKLELVHKWQAPEDIKTIEQIKHKKYAKTHTINLETEQYQPKKNE